MKLWCGHPYALFLGQQQLYYAPWAEFHGTQPLPLVLTFFYQLLSRCFLRIGGVLGYMVDYTYILIILVIGLLLLYFD